MASQVACGIPSLSGRRISRKPVYSLLLKKGFYARCQSGTFLCIHLAEKPDIVELKTSVVDTARIGSCYFQRRVEMYHRQSDSRRVFTLRENGACFHFS
ncbi:hypothetical protein TNCV_4884461 [Trichonephila clavipes]|nr:hypothetical protein TNCV_4884461 [Trichonephila clavipes]